MMRSFWAPLMMMIRPAQMPQKHPMQMQRIAPAKNAVVGAVVAGQAMVNSNKTGQRLHKTQMMRLPLKPLRMLKRLIRM